MLMLILPQLTCGACLTDFNTSHVNVNQLSASQDRQNALHFNTSHVNVNPWIYHAELLLKMISIHLMLMLIQ